MASLPHAIESTDSAILFRPSKKRKIYRQRINNEDEPSLSPAAPVLAPEQSIDELIASHSAGADNEAVGLEGTAVSMAEILRLRNLKKKRAGGVEFRAVETVRGDEESDALVLHDEEKAGEEAEADRVVRRFAPQTGTGGGGSMDVDRHM